MRGDILEGRNWKHLDSDHWPELGCMRENILEDSVTGIFLLVHDGPGHWVVKRAAHGVPGQVGAIEQHTGELLNLLKMISILVHVTDLTTCSCMCPSPT